MRFFISFLLALTLLMASCASVAVDSVNVVERTSNPACEFGGTLTCCQATFAGDLLSIQFLAKLTNYPLEPKDVNCIGIRNDAFASTSNCPGVKTCCQVVVAKDLGGLLSSIPLIGSLLSPLTNNEVIGLYCQGINSTCNSLN
ncbi:hypothetical protein NA57DRAFT_76681 [Rhizodiscina lignyota]|uniref:Hydrophobin n=1 Tax=Rhizodiscina lignyota TaxID=1504668 RepID=A0A9P4I9U3_9PEZI|nr:hypothetical protein NA57DRAFT_76681 [Rhizodiscina lignyota]